MGSAKTAPASPDAAPENLVILGSITLDRTSRLVRRSGRLLRLTPKDAELLDLLILHAGTALSREEIVQALWRGDDPVDQRTVDVMVGRLRRSLNRGWLPDPIRTVRGKGYKFEPACLGTSLDQPPRGKRPLADRD